MSGLSFALNDLYKAQLTEKSLAKSMLVGGMAGLTTHCIIYPMEFLRTRLAADKQF